MRSLMKFAIFICVALTLPGCWLTDQPKKHRVSPEIFICSTKEQAAQVAQDVLQLKYGMLESQKVSMDFTSYCLGLAAFIKNASNEIPADLHFARSKISDFIAMPCLRKIGSLRIRGAIEINCAEGKFRGIIADMGNTFGESPRWVVLTQVTRTSGPQLAPENEPNKGQLNKPKIPAQPPLKTITISFDSESHSVVVPTTLDLKKLASIGRGADIELRSDAPFSPKRGQQVVVTDADGELFYANHSPREYGREYVIHLEHIRKPANAETPKEGASR